MKTKRNKQTGFALLEALPETLFAPIKNQLVKRKMKAEKQKELGVMWNICLFESNASTKIGNISQYQLSKLSGTGWLPNQLISLYELVDQETEFNKLVNKHGIKRSGRNNN